MVLDVDLYFTLWNISMGKTETKGLFALLIISDSLL